MSSTESQAFQSTHPLRGATWWTRRKRCRPEFQSTHPLRGATFLAFGGFRLPFNFNPRTPCGVRPEVRRMESTLLHFNPRTPCGVRPATAIAAHMSAEFQSTHPLRGATRVTPPAPRHPLHFNPRTPCGVRPPEKHIRSSSCSISIHAPLAGCDAGAYKTTCVQTVISIHAPLAGCDVVAVLACIAAGISIHAPLAGCDNPA